MTFRKGWPAGVLAIAVAASSAQAVAPPESAPAAEVPLPTNYVEGQFDADVQRQMSESSTALEAFRSRYGNWAVALWHEETGAPLRAFGEPIDIVSGAATLESVEIAVRQFIDDNSDFFRVTSSDLVLRHVRRPNDTYYVVFDQTWRDIPVFGGQVVVRVDEQGQVVGIGSEVFSDVSVLPWASLDETRAADIAQSGLDLSDELHADVAGLRVLPVIWDDEVGYFLTYEVEISSATGGYRAYVDAGNGEIIWRHSTNDHIDFVGEVTGDVVAEDPFGPQYSAPMGFIRAYNAGATGEFDIADRQGEFEIGHSGSADQTLNARFLLNNQYFNVNNLVGADALATGVFTPGVFGTLHFDNSNSQLEERTPFHHLQEQRQGLIEVDPAFPFGTSLVTVRTNESGSCNAQWQSPSTIRLFRDGGGCIRMGQIPSAAAHEYGHGLTYWSYGTGSLPCAMIEAMPDIRAFMHTGEPTIGTNWQGPGTFIRNAENTLTWNQALSSCPTGGYSSGECHCKADVAMGAVWKMRKNLMRKYGDAAGADLANQIQNFAQYSAPSLPQSFLIDILQEDDNDSDLGNGTPNWTQICDAFAIHGLNCPSLNESVSITHTPLGDTASEADYTVNATVSTVSATVDEVFVTYRVAGGAWVTDPMSPAGGTSYTGTIPGQAAPTYVEYYLSATTLGGAETSNPLYAPGESYLFAVGTTQTILNDQAEAENGWTIGDPGDTASGGVWVRDDPNGTTSGGETANPEDDHTAAGTDCYFTGQGSVGGGAATADVDNGCTTLYSPAFSLSASLLARLSYWRWFFNPSTDDDYLTIEISNDGGSSWIEIEQVGGVQNEWTQTEFVFLDDVDFNFTANMQLRFVACDNAPGAIIEAGIDDLVISKLTGGGVATEEIPGIATFALNQNRPNPFNPVTTISYELAEAGRVTIDIFNVSGQRVRRLVDEVGTAAQHSVQWDGTNDAGTSVASGMYYYKMLSGDFEVTRSMSLLK